MTRAALLLLALLQFSARQDAGREENYFSNRLYPILEKAGCRACHVEDGVASGTRLRFPPQSATTREVEDFGLRLAALVAPDNPEASLLRTKPTARVKHTGGQRIAPGGEDERTLAAWVDRLARLGPDARAAALAGAPAAASRPRLEPMRRLTHSQYNNTVRDLLGDQTRPADRFPPEDFVHGFKNQADALAIPPLLAEAYDAAAERLARAAFLGGDSNPLIPCRPTGAADSDCAGEFIRRFGSRAYRRPVAAGEVERLLGVFRAEATRTGSFNRGTQLVIETMLVSPNFLFRVERAVPGLQGYAMASRLSYFLWDTMPDDALLEAAASGELRTVEGVERQARRLLSDPRARQALDEFLAQWLRFDRVLALVKDRRVFPVFTPELAQAMAEETRRLVHHLVWSDRSFMELFTADWAFVSSDLASLYSIAAPKEEFGRVDFPAGSDRAGILGQGTFLAATGKPEETSPTARGLFVREQFLCQRVPDPPPGTNNNLPPVSETKPQTTRERLEEHRANPACASCHTMIDPIGLGLEKFDAIGRRRERQRVEFLPAAGRERRGDGPRSADLAIEASGSVAGIPDSSFASPRELGRVLAASPVCQECVVRQLLRYALGRLETPEDGPTLKGAWAAFRDSQFRLRELMIYLVKTPQFRVGG